MKSAAQLLPGTGDPYAEGLALSAQGRHAEAIERFEGALAKKPDDTRVLFALGNTARKLGLAGSAENFYNRVLALEPGRLEATVNLANLLRAKGAFEAAAAILEPALARDPQRPELWLTLGSVHRETGDHEQAEAHYRAALKLQPGCVAALGNLADMRADAGDTDEALALYAQAIKADPNNAQARLNRAILHLAKGDLRQGWRDYAARLKLSGQAVIRDHKLPAWDGNGPGRRRILVTAEQGIGDQIMFASVLPGLIARAKEEGGAVIVECEPRLARLFARSFPGARIHAAEIEVRGASAVAHYGWLKAEGGANAAIEIGSLPRLMRRAISDFPDPNVYLVPDAAEVAAWRAHFAGAGNGPHIGICWRSGKLGGSRNLQFAPLEDWGAFLRRLPGTIVCAQYSADPREIAALEEMSGRKILIPPSLDQKSEIDRTAAMLAALNCVASAPTAVSWLSAACGTRTFKILYNEGWTSFGRENEPFAPAAACLAPERRGDWADAFAKAAALITARL